MRNVIREDHGDFRREIRTQEMVDEVSILGQWCAAKAQCQLDLGVSREHRQLRTRKPRLDRAPLTQLLVARQGGVFGAEQAALLDGRHMVAKGRYRVIAAAL